MEVSSKQQTTDAAWAFYAQLKDSLSQLDAAIGAAGNPDSDPNENPVEQNS